MTRKLYGEIRGASVGSEVAVKPLGYGGTNGAALTALATLGQYGLLSRTGKTLAITPLAIKILHPKSTDQQAEAIREAALAPKVMHELFTGFLECGAGVIEGHLIQNGFTPERAKRVAAIHIANKSFAKLTEGGTVPSEDENDLFDTADPAKTGNQLRKTPPLVPPADDQKRDLVPLPEKHKMLAQYTIPLGANQATLVFTGEALSADDFDALADFVEFSKKQFVRAQKFAQKFDATPAALRAIHHDGDESTAVNVVFSEERDGEKFYRAQDGTEIPESELSFPAPL